MKRSKLLGGIALGALASGFAIVASADTGDIIRPQLFEVAQGFDDHGKGKNDGPGNEQPTVTWVTKEGKTYLVSVYMSSDVEEGYWQCKCSSMEMTPQGPKFVANNVQLTYITNVERPCNHPRVATNGEDIVWVYGSDAMEVANTASYAGMIDETCNVVQQPFMFSPDSNNDRGATEVEYVGKDHFVGAYYHAGGGGKSTARELYLETNADTGKKELKAGWMNEVVTPSNIGRPAMAYGGTDRMLFCSAKGNGRPPEIGVECALLDTKTGETLAKEVIAKSDKLATPKIYYNQPSVAALPYGRYAVEVLRSNGEGRKTNEKGSNTAELYIIETTGDTLTIKAHETDLKLTWQTHSALCSGPYGDKGDVHLAVMGAPVSGVGQPTVQMFGYSPETGVTMNTKDRWITALYGDSGYAANMYGANPGNQGRDFLQCKGGLPNPGYVKPTAPDSERAGKFMPDVENFIVMPVAGQKPGEPKNALFMSLIPGKSNKALSCEGDCGPTGTTPTGGDGPSVASPTAGSNEQASGCSTSPAGSSGVAGVALIGLALAMAARRRREEG